MHSIQKYTEEIICIFKKSKKSKKSKNKKKEEKRKIKKKFKKKGLRFPKKKLTFHEAKKHRFKILKIRFKKKVKEEFKLQIFSGKIQTNKLYWKRYALIRIKKSLLKKKKYKSLKFYYDNKN